MVYRQTWLEGGKPPAPDKRTVDPLFPGVRFTSPAGKYVVGGIDPLVGEKLPADAEAVLTQLVLWMPGDSELLWHYAEVLNAEGKIDEACAVMDYLVDARAMGNFTELRQHRVALHEAGAEPTKTKKEDVAITPPVATNTSAPPPAPLIDWRTLSVGFAAGALVAIVTALQVQEWRRRRAAPRG
jgi:hypothetical protein